MFAKIRYIQHRSVQREFFIISIIEYIVMLCCVLNRYKRKNLLFFGFLYYCFGRRKRDRELDGN